ncbi:MAG: glycosyltransferase family 39 protein [Terrimicrobiaceae bacterium]
MNLRPVSTLPRRSFLAGLAGLIILTGILLRIDGMNSTALWCDEAESSINALTILDRGLPLNEYLGIPIYENTLTERWEGNDEYEFRDSSYSPQGLAVYHGWLPLYAIAASQALFGLHADHPTSPPRVIHGAEEIPLRTMAPRIPAIIFSALCLVLTYFLAVELGGVTAGFSALTLMALNAKTVDFGYEARYYSLTLLATVFAAWCLLQVVRRGRWSDYFLLGLSAALLFHTHQFSALVFAAMATVTLPAILRQPHWFWKSLCGGSLSALLVLPWIRLSGFLSTASSVPKARELFDSLADWLSYTLDRPDQLLLLGILFLLLIIGKWRPSWLPARIRAAALDHGSIYFVLLAWLVLGYAAFHLIVPAASFFYERLSLVLWTPYVLLIALLTADLLRGVSPKMGAVLAVTAMMIFLAARSRLAFFENYSVTGNRVAVASVIDTLGAIPFEEGTRFYATPNEHLTFTYYSGLPVQSVAPVRKSFFANLQKPVVFIESQMELILLDEDGLAQAAAAAGIPLGKEAIPALRDQVWKSVTARELAAQGLPSPLLPDIPEFLRPLVDKSHRDLLTFREKIRKEMQSYPIFRRVHSQRTKDFWMGFFYRFVNPEERIGPNLNILPRLKTASVFLLPRANTVIFLSNPPISSEPAIKQTPETSNATR